MSVDARATIIDWQSVKVEELIAPKNHSVMGSKGFVNIGGMKVYRVSFQTTLDALVGPITVYLDFKTLELLGFDIRY